RSVMGHNATLQGDRRLSALHLKSDIAGFMGTAEHRRPRWFGADPRRVASDCGNSRRGTASTDLLGAEGEWSGYISQCRDPSNDRGRETAAHEAIDKHGDKTWQIWPWVCRSICGQNSVLFITLWRSKGFRAIWLPPSPPPIFLLK